MSNWQGYRVTHEEVVELAIEALQRSNHTGFKDGILIGHPEDIVAALVPALEAVAVGYSSGYKAGRSDRTQQ